MITTEQLPDNPYLLLTPGPLSTTKSVKQVMLQDWCTWDDDYNLIVQSIRSQLVGLATSRDDYTSVLLQGSGSFGVEATFISAVPRDGKLLILTNGAYGDRMAEIARRCSLSHTILKTDETLPTDLEKLDQVLTNDSDITHVTVVHCETTTGLLNPIEAISRIVRSHRKIYIVDAMSSFGGIPIDMEALQIDLLISSANKCIQGIPGFSFVIAPRRIMETMKGRAGSLCLDLFDQWETMEQKKGKWRFTSPTHTVRAFAQALQELKQEGGVIKRFQRYSANQSLLVNGMQEIGFVPLLEQNVMSPVITSFLYPKSNQFDFKRFYLLLKDKGFVIYPGKISKEETFRIGTIGDVYESHIRKLLQAIKESIYWD